MWQLFSEVHDFILVYPDGAGCFFGAEMLPSGVAMANHPF
jgi:hypothetical protein